VESPQSVGEKNANLSCPEKKKAGAAWDMDPSLLGKGNTPGAGRKVAGSGKGKSATCPYELKLKRRRPRGLNSVLRKPVGNGPVAALGKTSIHGRSRKRGTLGYIDVAREKENARSWERRKKIARDQKKGKTSTEKIGVRMPKKLMQSVRKKGESTQIEGRKGELKDKKGGAPAPI